MLLDAQKPFEAAKVIGELRKISPRNAEASAVQGRIDKDLGDEEKAIVSFQRAITEGRGVQPEAYTGLGLLYKERAEGFGGEGDLENETANYDQAAKYLKTALKQLSGAPDSSVLYQLLGLIYERQKKFNEAIEVLRRISPVLSRQQRRHRRPFIHRPDQKTNGRTGIGFRFQVSCLWFQGLGFELLSYLYPSSFILYPSILVPLCPSRVGQEISL